VDGESGTGGELAVQGDSDTAVFEVHRSRRCHESNVVPSSSRYLLSRAFHLHFSTERYRR